MYLPTVLNIEVYKQKDNFTSPFTDTSKELMQTIYLDFNEDFTNTGIGDMLLIIEEEVFIKQWTDTGDLYVKPNYDAAFVRANPTIFEKL